MPVKPVRSSFVLGLIPVNVNGVLLVPITPINTTHYQQRSTETIIVSIKPETIPIITILNPLEFL